MHRIRLSSALLLVLAMGLASAGPAAYAQSDSPAPRVDVGGVLARVKERVRRTVEQAPSDWRRWVPRFPRSGEGGPTGRAISAETLGRVLVGYQAGVLKIVAADGETVLFIKEMEGSSLKAVDSVEFAPLTERHRSGIFQALEIGHHEVSRVAHGLMHEFQSLPATKAIAVLGVLASTPDARLSAEAAGRTRSFLCGLLRSERDPKVRRMAVLSLALAHRTDDATVAAVVGLLESSHNSWETFTTQQYFEYHRGFIQSMRGHGQIRRRIARSGNPYAPMIVAKL